MNRAPYARTLVSLLLAGMLGGCALGPDYQRPELAAPAQFKQVEGWKSAAPADALERGQWWALYGDAELNASEDKKKLELVQAKNQGEGLVHSVRKSLTEYGDKLEGDEKDKIEAAIKDVEESLKGEDKDDIEAKTNALMTASQKLGEKMYADMQAAQGAAGASSAAGADAAAAGAAEQGRPADDNVVDAEFKEVKKD